MRAAIGGRRRRVGAQIDPKFRILLAEADGRRTRFQFGVADGAEHGFIEARGAVEVTHSNGDVIDHAGAPDLTSL